MPPPLEFVRADASTSRDTGQGATPLQRNRLSNATPDAYRPSPRPTTGVWLSAAKRGAAGPLRPRNRREEEQAPSATPGAQGKSQGREVQTMLRLDYRVLHHVRRDAGDRRRPPSWDAHKAQTSTPPSTLTDGNLPEARSIAGSSRSVPAAAHARGKAKAPAPASGEAWFGGLRRGLQKVVGGTSSPKKRKSGELEDEPGKSKALARVGRERGSGKRPVRVGAIGWDSDESTAGDRRRDGHPAHSPSPRKSRRVSRPSQDAEALRTPVRPPRPDLISPGLGSHIRPSQLSPLPYQKMHPPEAVHQFNSAHGLWKHRSQLNATARKESKVDRDLKHLATLSRANEVSANLEEKRKQRLEAQSASRAAALKGSKHSAEAIAHRAEARRRWARTEMDEDETRSPDLPRTPRFTFGRRRADTTEKRSGRSEWENEENRFPAAEGAGEQSDGDEAAVAGGQLERATEHAPSGDENADEEQGLRVKLASRFPELFETATTQLSPAPPLSSTPATPRSSPASRRRNVGPEAVSPGRSHDSPLGASERAESYLLFPESMMMLPHPEIRMGAGARVWDLETVQGQEDGLLDLSQSPDPVTSPLLSSASSPSRDAPSGCRPPGRRALAQGETRVLTGGTQLSQPSGATDKAVNQRPRSPSEESPLDGQASASVRRAVTSTEMPPPPPRTHTGRSMAPPTPSRHNPFASTEGLSRSPGAEQRVGGPGDGTPRSESTRANLVGPPAGSCERALAARERSVSIVPDSFIPEPPRFHSLPHAPGRTAPAPAPAPLRDAGASGSGPPRAFGRPRRDFSKAPAIAAAWAGARPAGPVQRGLESFFPSAGSVKSSTLEAKEQSAARAREAELRELVKEAGGHRGWVQIAGGVAKPGLVGAAGDDDMVEDSSSEDEGWDGPCLVAPSTGNPGVASAGLEHSMTPDLAAASVPSSDYVELMEEQGLDSGAAQDVSRRRGARQTNVPLEDGHEDRTLCTQAGPGPAADEAGPCRSPGPARCPSPRHPAGARPAEAQPGPQRCVWLPPTSPSTLPGYVPLSPHRSSRVGFSLPPSSAATADGDGTVPTQALISLLEGDAGLLG